MAAEYHDTQELRGARFTGADLSGAQFRDCDLRGAKIADCFLVDVHACGLVERFFVNDVDVSGFVEAELDKRHPERVQVREMRTAEDYSAAWDRLERVWAEAVARAERLPEAARYERVDDEWSFVETLRHLVFATDAWAGRTVLDQERPFHSLGLPHSGHPAEAATAMGIDPSARPSFETVLPVRAGRQAVVRGIVNGLTDAELQRPCSRSPGPGYPEQTHSVGECLRVVMNEECEHLRYASRDLAVLEAR